MAIIEKLPIGWLISHEMFLADLYREHQFSGGLFDIKTPFMMDAQALASCRDKTRRKRKQPQRQLEAHEVQMKNMLDQLAESGLFKQGKPSKEEVIENNLPARNLAKNLMDEAPIKIQESYGKNESPTAVLYQDWLLPPRCEYFNTDVLNLSKALAGRKFKLILMDPPWQNKHVKRHSGKSDGYSMLQNDQVWRSIQVNDLLQENEQGYLAIWCTNSPRHQMAIHDWLQTWNLVHISTVYWLKVTVYGEPITSWHHSHKKPYEQLIIAARQKSDLKSSYILVSTPSSIHSHKPPLSKVFEDLGLVTSPDVCLEIFGRYLLPNYVTLGNQCLLFQNTTFFTNLTNDMVRGKNAIDLVDKDEHQQCPKS